MPGTDWADAAAMLRAMLTGDEAGFTRLAAEAEGGSTADAYSLLLTTAFIISVRRYFRDGYTTVDVIRLVAKLRSYSADAAEAVDPVGAESVIKTALREPSDPDAEPDAATKGNTQVGTLMILVGHQLSDEELDSFIADALAQARKGSQRS
jgi:hypothetical protein